MASDWNVRLLDAACPTIDTWWGAQNVCSTYWRLYIHDRPGAWVQTPQGRFDILPGYTHFIPAYLLFTCHNAGPVLNFFVHFDLVGWSGAMMRRVFDCAFRLPTKHPFDRVHPMMDRGRSTLTKLVRECRLKSLVLSELAELIAVLPDDKRDALDLAMAGRTRFSDVLQHIETHLASSMDNDSLAEVAHMSVSHFIRLFHRQMGQSPAKYVRERRVAHAAQQLLHSDESIDEIASRTGFANRFHLSRIFAEQMGTSPAIYRKTTRV